MRGYIVFLLIGFAIGGATSCAYDNPYSVSSATPSVVVFYGTVVDNNGEDVTGPGFIYGPVTLKWNGDKNFRLINLVITFPAGGKLSGQYDCSFDSATLEEAFPTMTAATLEPKKTYKSVGQFVCTGINAANENDNFILAGTTKSRGFTGGATDQKFYKADTKIFFYYFPENG